MKSYLSARQVVARLNGAVSVKLVYKLIAEGKLRVNRSLGKLLVEEESLVELLEGTARAPPEMPTAAPPRRARRPGADLW